MILTGCSLENGSEEQNNPVGGAVLDASPEVGCPLGFQETLLFSADCCQPASPDSLLQGCSPAISPYLHLCPALLHPRCRIWYLDLLTTMPLMIAQSML